MKMKTNLRNILTPAKPLPIKKDISTRKQLAQSFQSNNKFVRAIRTAFDHAEDSFSL